MTGGRVASAREDNRQGVKRGSFPRSMAPSLCTSLMPRARQVTKAKFLLSPPTGANFSHMNSTNREPEIVTRNGKPVSVIIPIKEYEELLERAEDAEDVAWLKRARKRKLHYRSVEDYLTERNGK
jgi:prevent-host-death family protein